MQEPQPNREEPIYVYPKGHPCQVRRKVAKRPESYFNWRDHPELVAKLKEVLADTNKTDEWWANRLTQILGHPFTKKQIEKFRCNFGVVGKVKRTRQKGRERREYIRKLWKEVHAEVSERSKEVDVREIWAETYNPRSDE